MDVCSDSRLAGVVAESVHNVREKAGHWTSEDLSDFCLDCSARSSNLLLIGRQLYIIFDFLDQRQRTNLQVNYRAKIFYSPKLIDQATSKSIWWYLFWPFESPRMSIWTKKNGKVAGGIGEAEIEIMYIAACWVPYNTTASTLKRKKRDYIGSIHTQKQRRLARPIDGFRPLHLLLAFIRLLLFVFQLSVSAIVTPQHFHVLFFGYPCI